MASSQKFGCFTLVSSAPPLPNLSYAPACIHTRITVILLLSLFFTVTKDYPDMNVDEEDDFDQFLASVKAKQASITSKGGANHGSKLHSITSDDEEDVQEDEEVDFGYWEKAASLPSSDSLSTDKLPDARARTEGLIKDIDLNLL